MGQDIDLLEILLRWEAVSGAKSWVARRITSLKVCQRSKSLIDLWFCFIEGSSIGQNIDLLGALLC